MIRAIKLIIAQKALANKRPLIATELEVARVTGKNELQQIEEVEALHLSEKVVIGETLNGIYYKLGDNEEDKI